MPVPIGDAIFANGDLGSYLQAKVSSIEVHIRKGAGETDLKGKDADFAPAILLAVRVQPLEVDFDHAVKKVDEVRIFVRDAFDGPLVAFEGVKVTKSFRFSGDARLFSLRPRLLSNIPQGQIKDGHVIIGVEGRSEPNKLRREIDRQEQFLRECVTRSTAQINRYNAHLPRLIEAAVSNRGGIVFGYPGDR